MSLWAVYRLALRADQGRDHQPVLGATLAFLTVIVLRMISVRYGGRVPDPLWINPGDPK